MSTFDIQYKKAHGAQVKLLIEWGIQIDADGYTLCSATWLSKVLSPKQLREYDYYESVKDELNRIAKGETYEGGSQVVEKEDNHA